MHRENIRPMECKMPYELCLKLNICGHPVPLLEWNDLTSASGPTYFRDDQLRQHFNYAMSTLPDCGYLCAFMVNLNLQSTREVHLTII